MKQYFKATDSWHFGSQRPVVHAMRWWCEVLGRVGRQKGLATTLEPQLEVSTAFRMTLSSPSPTALQK